MTATMNAVKAKHAFATALADTEARLLEQHTDPAEVAAIHAALERYVPSRTDDGFTVVARSYADITPKVTEWLWDGRLPLGALSLLVGTEGLGKTAAAFKLAALITRGELPGALHGTPATVALFTPEDDAERVLWARLKAAGADLTRVRDVQMKKDASSRGFSLPGDTEAIIDALAEADAKFAFADPLASMLDPKADSWKDTDIRRALEPLVGACAVEGITLLGSLHTNKSRALTAREKAIGSTGWRQLARSSLLLGPDPEDPDGLEGSRRCLVHEKSNYGRMRKTVRVTLEDASVDVLGVAQSVVCATLGEECDVTQAQVLAAEQGGSTEDTKAKKAESWLDFYLCEGPKAVNAVRDAAAAKGFAWRTVEEAKKNLGVRAVQRSRAWYWELPSAPGLSLG